MKRKLLALVILAAVATPVAAAEEDNLFNSLSYRLVGPFRGGRVTAVTGVPGDPMTYYMGSTGGGVWKTTDAGRPGATCRTWCASSSRAVSPRSWARSTRRWPRSVSCVSRSAACRRPEPSGGSAAATPSAPPPSAPSRSRRPTPTSSMWAPVRRARAATSRPVTASTSRPTPATPGATSVSRRPVRSGASWSTRPTPTSSTPRSSATSSDPTRSAASTARPTAV